MNTHRQLIMWWIGVAVAIAAAIFWAAGAASACARSWSPRMTAAV